MTEPTRAAPVTALRDWFRHDVERPLENAVGGRLRLKVVVLLACVLALDSADSATVGAVAAQLKSALHIGNVEVGLLVTASTAVGVFVTLPFGALADRVRRNRMLLIAIVGWSVAMLVGGFATSYLMLLLSRLALGVVIAAAAPVAASLTGDFFEPHERGRVYSYMLAGELLGVAVGFLVSGNLAAIISWRGAFWVLGGAGLILAFVIWRKLPEPVRGGSLGMGQDSLAASDGAEELSDVKPDTTSATEAVVQGDVEQKVEAHDIKAHDALVLHQDPSNLSLWAATRYILSIRTYRTLVLASGLGYFYFAGLRTFAIVFMRGRFGLDQAAASTLSVGLGLGAIVGVLLSGFIADRLIQHEHLTGRVLVGAAAFFVATAAFLPSLLTTSLVFAAPFFFIAAAGIGGANPAVDAARLDVMHSRLWGRAEGVRATLRFALTAIAPPLFGYVADQFGGSHASGLGAAGAGSTSNAGAIGLDYTFLIMLVPLLLAGVILLRAVRTYPRDVATAVASEHATHRSRHSSRAEPASRQ